MKSTKLVLSNDKVTVDLPAAAPGGNPNVVLVDANGKMGLGQISVSGAYNGSRTSTNPLFAGFNPHTSTVAGFLDALFYPSVGPALSLSLQAPVREYGDPDAADTLTITATQHSNAINEILLNDNDVNFTPGLGDGYVISLTQAVPVLLNQSNGYHVVVHTSGTDQASSDIGVSYTHRRFYFLSDVDLTLLSDADLSAQLNQRLAKSELGGGKQQQRQASPANQYVYFVYLAAYGAPAFTVNGLANTDFKSKTGLYTNQYGYQAPFLVTRTGSKLSGNYAYSLS